MTDTEPDGPHEAMAQIAAEVHEATNPRPRSVARWVAVLAVFTVLSSVLSFLALVQTQSTIHDLQAQRKAGHDAQVKINAQQKAVNEQVIINGQVSAQLAAEQDALKADQAAIPGQVDARLCELVKALTPPNAKPTSERKALLKQIHCTVP